MFFFWLYFMTVLVHTMSDYCYKLLTFDVGGSGGVFLNSIFAVLKDLPGTSVIKSTSTSTPTSSIHFCANSVKPLKEMGIDYDLALCMMRDLYKQQTFLLNHGYGFYCIGLDDILVIDSSTFVCICPDIMREIGGKAAGGLKDFFNFYSPFSRTQRFFSPEIMQIHFLPASISIHCFYYSLGALIVYCLFGKKIDGMDGRCDYEHVLAPIAQTKLYWLLLKSLDPDCERRSLIYI